MTKKNSKLREYNKQIFSEYKKSIKHSVFDETLTLYILRPIAFIFVKILYPTNITPNQVSLMTIIIGIISGFIFAQGTVTSFIVGGLLYFLCMVTDCVDGMIARLKNNGTPTGRIIDGFADYMVGISVYVGMGIGFEKGIINLDYLKVNPWWIIIIAAVSHIFHAMLVDYYRSEFMAHGLGKAISIRDDKIKFSEELNKIKHMRGKWLDKILISTYLGYSRLQIFHLDEKEEYDRETYYNSNKLLIRLWFWIGPTAGAFVIIISALLFRPMIFFIYTIGLANIYMIILWIIQVKVNKKILINNK
ncbi:MAG: CDP-alcohol phosphatidyltransferase family protein [Candidatus Cloacimonetes bacterium]|jgi:phosphatidylglycerophosphate synthase|nr:CDP-alcohol phosphatidyltransferase family protein [Candidatus Cloacimonadota bacterium]